MAIGKENEIILENNENKTKNKILDISKRFIKKLKENLFKIKF